MVSNINIFHHQHIESRASLLKHCTMYKVMLKGWFPLGLEFLTEDEPSEL